MCTVFPVSKVLNRRGKKPVNRARSLVKSKNLISKNPITGCFPLTGSSSAEVETKEKR